MLIKNCIIQEYARSLCRSEVSRAARFLSTDIASDDIRISTTLYILTLLICIRIIIKRYTSGTTVSLFFPFLMILPCLIKFFLCLKFNSINSGFGNVDEGSLKTCRIFCTGVSFRRWYPVFIFSGYCTLTWWAAYWVSDPNTSAGWMDSPTTTGAGEVRMMIWRSGKCACVLINRVTTFISIMKSVIYILLKF